MSQSKHDLKVKQIANSLKRQGYKVKADIPGFTTPKPIGQDNYVPDIIATKTSSKKIIEVETPSSLNTDKKQQEAFKRSAGQQYGTTFEIEMTKK